MSNMTGRRTKEFGVAYRFARSAEKRQLTVHGLEK